MISKRLLRQTVELQNIPDPKSINLQTDNLELLSEVERDIALDSARLKIETRTGGELRTYMVSLELIDDDPAMIQESLQELGSLIRSLGDDCVGVTVQKRSKITPATYIGSGKAEEIKASATELRVDYVAFDKELSPSQVRNLEKSLAALCSTAQVLFYKFLDVMRKHARPKHRLKLHICNTLHPDTLGLPSNGNAAAVVARAVGCVVRAKLKLS